MNDWLADLNPREKRLVASAAAMAAAALFWFAVWQPLESSEQQLATDIASWQRSLGELRPLRARLESGSIDPASVDMNESLVVIVDNTLRSRNLYAALQRSQPTADEGIRVEFENAAFDDLVLWLGELASRYGLRVQSASFSNTSATTSGRVNASLTLKR